MTNEVLIIVGAGGFGREVCEWATDQMLSERATFSDIKFIDDKPNRKFSAVAKNYMGRINEYNPCTNHRIVLAIGNSVTRRLLAKRLTEKGAVFGSVIHPTAIVARSSQQGSGLIMCPYSLVSSDVVIGSHVHMNVSSTIGHDTKVGDFVTLSGHVDITGSCNVEDDVFLGSGSRVLPKCFIAAGTSVGAGATVQRSVRQKSVLYQAATKKM